MKKFIKKILVFALFPVLYFGLNGALNFFIYRNSNSQLNHSSILILGDSHTQKALNPALFSSAQNISQTAEPYILSYWKLKSVIPQIKSDTLIIGFAPHNISQFNDLKFSNPDWSYEMFRRSYAIEDFQSVERDVEIDYAGYYKILWKQTGFYPRINHHLNYVGKYSNHSLSNTSNSQDAISRHYFINGKESGVSEVSIAHLDSIINLCALSGVKPILISTPVHSSYNNRVPLSINKKFEALKDKYMKKGITVIDGSTVNYPDSLFLDSDHLNERGATRFTNEIKALIKLNSQLLVNAKSIKQNL